MPFVFDIFTGNFVLAPCSGGSTPTPGTGNQYVYRLRIENDAVIRLYGEATFRIIEGSSAQQVTHKTGEVDFGL